MQRTIVAAALGLAISSAALAGPAATAPGWTFIVGPDEDALKANVALALEAEARKALIDAAAAASPALDDLITPDRAVFYLKDDERAARAIDDIQRRFTGRPDFRVSSAPTMFKASPARILTISLAGASADKPPDLTAQPPPALWKAAAEARAIVAPPPPALGIEQDTDGLTVRAREPARAMEAARLIRQGLAARPDLTVDEGADSSIHIRYAANHGRPPSPRADNLAGSVRACLRMLKLADNGVSAVDSWHIRVDLGSDQQADILQRVGFSRCGFSMREVVQDAGGGREAPPSPGDQRFPQVRGPDLWLKPAEIITADMIQDAEPAEFDGQFVVRFKLSPEGRRRFALFTAAYVQHRFAIVLDGTVFSAPYIDEPITGGEGLIYGAFTADAAKSFARSILAGGPPFPIKIVEARRP